MSNTIQSFFDEKFGEIKTVIINNEIWFLANDIANVLGYTDKGQAIRKHTFESDRKILNIKEYKNSDSDILSLWGKNDMRPKTLITEAGVYCMIFGSQLKDAETFKTWVAREVLPSIRKNGGYIDKQELLPQADLEKVNKKVTALSQKVDKLVEKNKKLSKKNENLKEENSRIKEKWHLKNQAYKILEDKKNQISASRRYEKRERKALDGYAEFLEEWFNKILQENTKMLKELKVLKANKNPMLVPHVIPKAEIKEERRYNEFDNQGNWLPDCCRNNYSY